CASPNFQRPASVWNVTSKVPLEICPAHRALSMTSKVSGLTLTNWPGLALSRETSLSGRQELISASRRRISASEASMAWRILASSRFGLVYAMKVTLVPIAEPLNSTLAGGAAGWLGAGSGSALGAERVGSGAACRSHAPRQHTPIPVANSHANRHANRLGARVSARDTR